MYKVGKGEWTDNSEKKSYRHKYKTLYLSSPMSNKFKQNKCFLKLKEIAEGIIYCVPARVGEY